MITDTDISKLKKVLATKTDLEDSATKKEILAVRDSVDLLRKKVADVGFENLRLDMRLNAMEASGVRTEEKVDKILNILDGFAGKVADLDQENKMGARTLHRHGIQIRELAQATSTTLSE